MKTRDLSRHFEADVNCGASGGRRLRAALALPLWFACSAFPSIAAAQETVKIPGGEVRKTPTGCYVSSQSDAYNKRVRQLAEAAFGANMQTEAEGVGCLTYPYRGDQYFDCTIKNEVHAGVDFRAPVGTPVYAVEAGHVVERSFDPAQGRSTLIIENDARTQKILYLHMSSIDVTTRRVERSAPIGKTGSVGADAPHLHIEVWPNTSPLYSSRTRAISGSACPSYYRKTTCEDAPANVCRDADIAKFTLDPIKLAVAGGDTTTSGAAGPVGTTGRELPSVPYVERKAITPDIFTGKWRLNKPATLYSSAGPDGRVLREVPKGAVLKATSLEVHTRQYQTCEFRKPRTIYLWESQNNQKEYALKVAAGEKLAVMSYYGEGECVVWFRAKTYVGFCPGSEMDPEKDIRCDHLSGKIDEELWAAVSLSDGTRGWLKDPDAKGMSKHGPAWNEPDS